MTPAGNRTGPKPRFGESDAVHAALELGLDTFTLASVARRLNVGTSSLYRVISSREDLVTMCLRHIIDHMQWSPEVAAWDRQLLEASDSIWDLMEQYPGLDHTLINSPGAALHFQDFFQKQASRLVYGGFPGDHDRIEFALDFILDTTISTHYQLVAVRRNFDSMKAAAGQSTEFFTPEDSWLDRGWLDRKLQFIIAGLKAGLDQQR
ncbi:TetR/AcrR family transcriptional regulator [Corynebacterium sp. 320]|uniref:TetR/AcrR family transcriptional regulator n=1 Tax=Corynebacterium TaxID=1716 RepID=UPI00125CC89D|nr:MULTISPECIES: TetR/AcrR family transcriptional regulator [Corynebacterium]KAB1504064.1 TetR/AcrR family transcriptional regulator [Corynebacterium sp. 320]KAB1552837.1 TetR/AcrR family transcriptional regulator [Corynebacterium sp. 321]KAB1553945.1 TetR/AcrR family transcriptional regulator [Corynebacterium sp. 319]KAB3528200.1 TetR/AcrR family transcriptional regulator [Corynebacterium sp. 250]KAB3540312.1 TetR/AcrR family transcriptional regulator [Corynebacterium sp. 366]